MVDLIARHIIPATFVRLPSLASDNAAIMLLAIGLQESRFLHRRQIDGPARGYWQFERIATLDVLTRTKTALLAHEFCQSIGYKLIGPIEQKVNKLHPLLEHNDILACGFARLKLFHHPEPLPMLDEPLKAWDQYKSEWRPGKPHPDTWSGLYQEAVDRVTTTRTDTRFA